MEMKIFDDKKGLERGLLVLTILIILGAGIIFLSIYRSNPYKAVDKEACRASIAIRSTPIAGESLKAAAPLNCRTEQIKIDKSYRTEEQIKKKVADAMAECWSIVGKGEMNFMPQGFWGDKYCLICSTIEFDKNAKQNFPVVSGLLYYMSNTEMPVQKQKYFNYLWGEDVSYSGNVDFDIDTSKDYAVIFSLYKSGWLKKNLVNIAGATGTVAIIGATFLTGGSVPVISLLIVRTAAQLGLGYYLANTAIASFFSTNAGEAGLYLTPYDGKEIQKYCSRFENAP